MISIGIDPGLTGAVAVIKKNGKIRVFDTPVEIIKKGKSAKKEYLPVLMANILKDIIDRYEKHSCFIYLEKVHAMPKQGVVSMFNFGKGYGIWIGIISALQIACTDVTPQAWKKEMMLGMTDKDAARIRAQQLFPKYANLLNLKKHIGRADAILIAEYGRRKGL